MRVLFYLVNLCLIYEVVGKGDTGHAILDQCVRKVLGNYHTPMKPCFSVCANELQRYVPNGKQMTECFFNNDPRRLDNGTACIRKHALCKKRSARDVMLNLDPEYEEHDREERASEEKLDVYLRVILDAITDDSLKTPLKEYHACKFNCYLGHHTKNMKENFNKGKRANRARRYAQRSRKSTTSSASTDYFTWYFGRCYELAKCKPGPDTSKDCMPLFFQKKDPQKFCNCMQQHDPRRINCDKYNGAPGSPDQKEDQNDTPNFINAAIQPKSASGNVGGSNWNFGLPSRSG